MVSWPKMSYVTKNAPVYKLSDMQKYSKTKKLCYFEDARSGYFWPKIENFELEYLTYWTVLAKS